MFDWNDEELANIVWDEAGDNGDHIVPFPGGNEEKPPGSHGIQHKEWTEEAANVKLTEQKGTIVATEFHGDKGENYSQYDMHGEKRAAGMGFWPDLSLSNTARPDDNHMDDTDKEDDGSEIFENQPKDMEQGDFLDYGWASIGSFDDLDSFLSHDDPKFGHVNLVDGDELWSSSKDVSSPERSVSLSLDPPSFELEVRSNSELIESKGEYMLVEKQHNLGLLGLCDYSSHSPKHLEASLDNLEHGGWETKNILNYKAVSDAIGDEYVSLPHESTEKMSMQRKLLNNQDKTTGNNEARSLQTFCSPRAPFDYRNKQFDCQHSQLMGHTSSSLEINLREESLGSDSYPYKHIRNPFLATGYQIMGDESPAISLLAQFHDDERHDRHMASRYEHRTANSNPLNNALVAPAKVLNMTPQEKIEKLRRRQQLRAMLAIRKQEQQFSHQVPHECLVFPSYSLENQVQMEGGNIGAVENLSSLLSIDPCSLVEQNDSKLVSMTIDRGAVEDTILSRLQDVIEKLDFQIRLCIRDSLFRLAKSSVERQYAGDTTSTNKNSIDDSNIVMEEGMDGKRRLARVCDAETKTNPIDRTVAHLLFHRPLELSGKIPETLQFTSGKKTIANKFFTKGSEDDQPVNNTRLFAEEDASRSPCMENPENGSNNEKPDAGAMEVETSQ